MLGLLTKQTWCADYIGDGSTSIVLVRLLSELLQVFWSETSTAWPISSKRRETQLVPAGVDSDGMENG